MTINEHVKALCNEINTKYKGTVPDRKRLYAFLEVNDWFGLENIPDISPRIEEYKKAVKLYCGPVYREASHEHWLLPTSEHYAIEYLF